MEKKRVLIFPAGAENALEIYDALRYNVNIEVYGASGKKDYAEYLYDEAHYIEGDFYYKSKDFPERFNKLLNEYKIDIVIPTHDDIALYLAENRGTFKTKILGSDAETARVCRSKRKTYEVFRDMKFCPNIYDCFDSIQENEYPIFIKPDIGVGGKNTKIISSYNDDCLSYKERKDEFVFCEYLPGQEYTIDCYTNRNGELIFAGARTRDRIQMGIAFRSTTVEMTDEIKEIANSINQKLRFFGAWYFQLKEDKHGILKLLEVSCRQAGTMTLYRHLGVNFPLLGIFELCDVDVSYIRCIKECQIERRLTAKFKINIVFSTVYLDFDDTLVVNGKVCDVVIRFIYQCINNGKRIILLTQHEGKLDEDMSRLRISKELFDKIEWIDQGKSKSDYICSQESIVIDNSYAIRKEIWEKKKIPVFDVDMLDMLLNV